MRSSATIMETPNRIDARELWKTVEKDSPPGGYVRFLRTFKADPDFRYMVLAHYHPAFDTAGVLAAHGKDPSDKFDARWFDWIVSLRGVALNGTLHP